MSEQEKASEVVVAGQHDYTGEDKYIPPKDEVVQKHLAEFRDLKLGFMMHWAPVCQLGLVESWALSDGDRDWSQVEIDWTDDIEEFKQQYWALNKTFNPIKFRPDKIAKLAKECGFKYLLFTTKHHDGFCMYDTKQTDYKITASDCPFSTNKRANIVKEMFDAFRHEGMAISAYFSKPDWHSDYYWHSEFGNAPTRNVNYNIDEHPELWEEFVQFVHRQLTEITTDYGKIDVIWLDGGWVSPSNLKQDIRLGEIIEKIRKTTQPHLICCDRTVGGEYENIVTPEQSIPENPMDIPWETCMTLGRNFSYHYDEVFKTPLEVIHNFVEIVSKGGSLALNVTPRPDGALPQVAVEILRQLGHFMAVNGEGIYATRIAPFKSTRELAYTKKGNTIYAFRLYDIIPALAPHLYLDKIENATKVTLLRTGETVPFSYDEGRLVLHTAHLNRIGMQYADCFKITLN